MSVSRLSGRIQVSHTPSLPTATFLFIVFVVIVVYSLRTLFRKCKNISCTMLVVRTTSQEVYRAQRRVEYIHVSRSVMFHTVSCIVVSCITRCHVVVHA